MPMFIEYYCEECDVKELETQIIPMKKCPECEGLMFANEWDFDQ